MILCSPAAVSALAIGLVLTIPVNGSPQSGLGLHRHAQEKPAPELPEILADKAEAYILEAVKRAIELATSLGAAVPYELPEELPNGDIIIRRKHPLQPEEPAPGPRPNNAPGITDL
ncbi:hypothetical protein [Azospirillum sp. SYSU D00513]|uniref:hypothetical protein n=1 Tax=Azospirillum sp. SYSU D00513 TaxID=2812561 RepID=UPI001A95E480|nr:hypothetical protein [Azospirillum sp. SYSU D00513]